MRRRSLDLCIVPAAHADLVKDLMSTETSLSAFTGDRASRTRALHTAFQGHILAAIAAPFPAMLRAVPQHVLLRASPAHEWTLRNFRQTFYDHCLRDHCHSFTLSAQVVAADLRHIGSTLSLPYAGVWSHCHGDVASFLPVSADLPHFPPDVPVRLRPTYWTWVHDDGNRDLLISSLDGVLQSLVVSLHGVEGLSSPLSWAAALTASMRVCCDDDLGRVSFLQAWTSFLQAPESDWSQRPPTLARPRFLADYQLLGSHLGLHYLGVRSQDRALCRDIVPPTLLSLTAVFADVIPSPDTDWDAFWDRCTQTSYIQAYLRWQNRVPTFARMRTVLQQLNVPGDLALDASTFDLVLAEFPAAPRAIVEAVCSEVLHTRAAAEWNAVLSSHALTAELQRLPRTAEFLSSVSTPASEDVAARVEQLRQAELAVGCNDLTHPQPPLARGVPRRAGGLGEQRLSGPTASGLRIQGRF